MKDEHHFQWSVNIKSMQDKVCGSRWVGCDTSWWNPCTVVRDSSCVASIVILSLVHQTEDLSLKSSKVMVNKELQEVVYADIFSKFDKKVSNSKTSFARRSMYHINITYAILHRDFTNNAFTKNEWFTNIDTYSFFVKDTNTISFWITCVILPEKIVAIQLDVFVRFSHCRFKERFGYTDKIMFINWLICFKLRNLRSEIVCYKTVNIPIIAGEIFHFSFLSSRIGFYISMLEQKYVQEISRVYNISEVMFK